MLRLFMTFSEPPESAIRAFRDRFALPPGRTAPVNILIAVRLTIATLISLEASVPVSRRARVYRHRWASS